MNLKKTLLSCMAAGSILAAGFGGGSAQNSDTASGQAVVSTSGTFNVFICHSNATSNELINFGSATITSEDPTATLSSQMVICYTDTLPQRGAFKTHLSSTDFSHTTMSWNKIESSNLKPTKIYNVGQGQWGKVDGDPNGEQIGNIGGRDSAGTSVNSATGDTLWGSTTFADGPLWVGHGNPGVGTASDWYITQGYDYDARSSNGSWAPIDMELTVPNTTVAGTYKNTFTVDVTFTVPN